MKISIIDGPRSLPSHFDHPHASEQARSIAERGTILRAQVGSGMHGTALDGQDDRDEMGICLEPHEYVTGLARVPAGIDSDRTVEFEQFQRHTVWDKPGGLSNSSGPGDLDVVIYSARKWCRLALAGNPTALLLLFVPDDEVIVRDEAAVRLVGNADRFASKIAGERFRGYMRSQKNAMFGPTHTPATAGRSEHGYDPKHAMHAMRLGLQGIEFLSNGHMTLPIPEPSLSYLRSVRRGEVEQREVVSYIEHLENELTDTQRRSGLAEQPDHNWVNRWLHDSYTTFWDNS